VIIAVTEMAASAAAQHPAVFTFVRLMHERDTGFHRIASRPSPASQDIPRESSGIANVSPSLVSPLRERSNATFRRARIWKFHMRQLHRPSGWTRQGSNLVPFAG
jgi:hypothetical protein